MLEENIEQSLLHEEKAIESSVEGSVSSDDALALQKTLKETKSRHDVGHFPRALYPPSTSDIIILFRWNSNICARR